MAPAPPLRHQFAQVFDALFKPSFNTPFKPSVRLIQGQLGSSLVKITSFLGIGRFPRLVVYSHSPLYLIPVHPALGMQKSSSGSKPL